MNRDLILRIVQEIKNPNAVQTSSIAEKKMLDLDFTQTFCSAGKKYGIARRWHQATIEQTVTFAGDASKNITTLLPAYSRVKEVIAIIDVPLVYSTAVKFGVGSGATPSGLLLSDTTTTLDHANVSFPAEATSGGSLVNAAGSSGLQLAVTACATGGTAAGTITSGSIRVYVVYEYMDLPATIDGA